MILKLVYDNTKNVLSLPEEVLPPDGQPLSHQFKGTTPEQLCELAGRTCFDEETEVLTYNGWVKFPNLEKNIPIATFNRSNSEIEFQIPTHYIKQKYSGKMVLCESNELSFYVTADHDMYVNFNNKWQIIKAEDLIGIKSYIARCGKYDGKTIENFIIPDHTYKQVISNKHGTYGNSTFKVSKGFTVPEYKLKYFAEFLGYYFSEGCIGGGKTNKKHPKKSGYNIIIYQHERTAKPIFNCITKLGWKYSYTKDIRNGVLQIRIYNAVLARYLLNFGTNSYNKFLPRELLHWPANLRKILLNALMYGDGGRQDGKARIYTTMSKKLADDIQELITGLNKVASCRLEKSENKYIIRECDTYYWTLNNKRNLVQSQQVKNINVYCVSVPNRTLLVRRHGQIFISCNCYDSCTLKNSRPTHEYFKHIHEARHTSILEHFNYTLGFDFSGDLNYLNKCLANMVDRPGTSCNLPKPHQLNITTNLRAALEWEKWTKFPNEFTDQLTKAIKLNGHKFAPLIINKPLGVDGLGLDAHYISPTANNEIWLSFYVSDVSRNLTHELIRHKYRTAVSQRSTRYVDESDSSWSWHPLIQKYCPNISVDYFKINLRLAGIQEFCRNAYNNIFNSIEQGLITDGIDRFTAKKQGRGAARGILGTCLSTELIWSANLDQIVEVIKQRATIAADAEIRLFGNKLYEIVSAQYPNLFVGCTNIPSPDGIGYEVKWP